MHIPSGMHSTCSPWDRQLRIVATISYLIWLYTYSFIYVLYSQYRQFITENKDGHFWKWRVILFIDAWTTYSDRHVFFLKIFVRSSVSYTSVHKPPFMTSCQLFTPMTHHSFISHSICNITQFVVCHHWKQELQSVQDHPADYILHGL